MTKKCLRSISIIFLALAVTAVVRPQDADRPAPAAQDRLELVHLGDLIDVDVVGSFDFDWRGTLNPEGFLDGLDLVQEPIYALCRSESDLAADLTKAYSKSLRDPTIVVRILDRSNRAVVFLDGAVKFPQRFQIRRPIRLNELLIVAGGITENASGVISIFRPQNLSCAVQPPAAEGSFVKASTADGPQTFSIRIADLLAGEARSNPQVLSGDIVTVAEAMPVYVMGGVNAPKQVSARTRTTLSRAVAAAGGVSKKGLESSVTIYRREGNETKILQADLRKIEAAEVEDPVLKPFDIVEVGQKGVEKRRFAPVIDNAGFQTSKLVNLPLRIIE